MKTIRDLATFEHYFLYWDANAIKSSNIEDRMKEVKFRRNSPTTRDDTEDNDSYYRTKSLQASLVPFVQLFLEIVAGDLENATRTQDEVNSVIPFTAFDERYLLGFEYLHVLVKLHFKLAFPNVTGFENIQEGDINVRDAPLTKPYLDAKYTALGNQGQCVVVLAQWMLNLTHHRSCRDEGLEIMNKMIELDGTNWYWYNKMYNGMRYNRRSFGAGAGLNSMPSIDEMKLVSDALNYVGGDNSISRLRCNANLCQCLADIVKFQCINKQYETVTLDKEYRNVAEMLEHINTSANDSEHFGDTDRIQFADILGITLPRYHRNYRMASDLITEALANYPNDSKAHHKMGAIIVNMARLKKQDMDRAIYHFEEAIRLEPRSFPPWADLLAALLRDYSGNERKIERALESALALASDNQWTQAQLGAFYFYKGSQAFLKGSNADAVQSWREMLAKGYNGFKKLATLRARFSFPVEHALDFVPVKTVLDGMYTEVLKSAEEISLLGKMVDEANQKQEEFLQQINYARNENRGQERS